MFQALFDLFYINQIKQINKTTNNPDPEVTAMCRRLLAMFKLLQNDILLFSVPVYMYLIVNSLYFTKRRILGKLFESNLFEGILFERKVVRIFKII